MKAFDFTWKFELFVQDEEDVWYAVRVEEPWRHGSDVFDTSQELAVVLARELRDEGTKFMHAGQKANLFSFEDFTAGVLVSIVRTAGKVNHVTAHSHVVVNRFGQGLQSYLSSASGCAEDVNLSYDILVNESHTASRDRCRDTVENYIRDPRILETLVGRARYFGENSDREAIVDDLLDITVVTARFGECRRARRVDRDQQWCVD
ncbi:MAG: hypothetical protein Q9224_007454 [Gallowayella concinna]